MLSFCHNYNTVTQHLKSEGSLWNCIYSAANTVLKFSDQRLFYAFWGHIASTVLVPLYCLQNCLKFSRHRLNKEPETFLRDYSPCWHDSSTQLLQICHLYTISSSTSSSSLNNLYKGEWIHAFMLFTYQTIQCLSNLLLSSCDEPIWIIASTSQFLVLSWQPVWSSAAVAHLL